MSSVRRCRSSHSWQTGATLIFVKFSAQIDVVKRCEPQSLSLPIVGVKPARYAIRLIIAQPEFKPIAQGIRSASIEDRDPNS